MPRVCGVSVPIQLLFFTLEIPTKQPYDILSEADWKLEVLLLYTRIDPDPFPVSLETRVCAHLRRFIRGVEEHTPSSDTPQHVLQTALPY